MLRLNDAFYSLKNELQSIYDANEAAAIAHELLYHLTGLSKFERLLHKEQLLTELQYDQFLNAKDRLLTGEPLQYVTGTQWFMGREFKVNEHVLIPRPETEELVQWIANDWKEKTVISILDIGTGSGCIPVSLKLQLPQATILSGDISAASLEVAEQNALKYDAVIELAEIDFLDERTWSYLGAFDVIVSNPPYIPEAEKQHMHMNVIDYEPGLALFVPDDDPLLFYKKIARFAQAHLKTGGAVYCEVHKAHARETRQLFECYFREVILQNDIHENERMVKAQTLIKP
ncbi:MAG TPA: peptide chain release factor N(5)-glutamine methyltransferase [Flavipsychrobacter sp.]|nr:peptide chain release factor N(5)-glutamine methyltransferase [Flavipsychrobacter sp.]